MHLCKTLYYFFHYFFLIKSNTKIKKQQAVREKTQSLRYYDCRCKTYCVVLQTQAPIVQRDATAFFLFLTSLLLRRIRVDSLKLTSCGERSIFVRSTSSNPPEREPLNFPRFSRGACGIAPKPMREHWLIRDKHEAVRNRQFSCNAV